MNRPNETNPLLVLEPLLQDPTIIEIMVDGHEQVYVDRNGQLEDVPSPFRDEAHLMEVVEAIFTPLGLRVDESHPVVDGRLPDGSRINIVIPPISPTGPVLTIRKFPTGLLTAKELLHFGSWSKEMVEFLRACVLARLNMVVAGGTGSGKTTVLNIIAGMIPPEERIIVIQHVEELALLQKRVVVLESRPANLEGRGEVTTQDLMVNALKMRPDRVVLCEVMKGNEALILLEAAGRGHDGNLMTMHASNLRDVLFRLESTITAGNPSLPLLHVRQMMASTIHIITYQEQLRDGKRKVLKVAEVQGMQGDAIILQDIFEFRQTGFEEGQVTGYFTATGHIPKALSQIRAAGIDLPVEIFSPRPFPAPVPPPPPAENVPPIPPTPPVPPWPES
jgi:pilus assembly protein CpaF